MDFIDFCRERGVIIDHVPPIGRWSRHPTEDKPRSDNGAVKYMGDHGFVQNHATMLEVDVWRPDAERSVDPLALAKMRRNIEAAEEDKKRLQRRAAELAANILASCRLAGHPYLIAKGFVESEGLVYKGAMGKDEPEQRILAVPMRIGDRLTGMQRIGEDGTKKFLFGQESTGAEFRFAGVSGPDLLCEGYATGLSIKAALKGLRMANAVRVCFSAYNLRVVSERMVRPHGIVADNDESGTGARYPTEAGIPFWLSPKVGDDFNDYSQRVRSFAAGQSLRKLLTRIVP